MGYRAFSTTPHNLITSNSKKSKIEGGLLPKLYDDVISSICTQLSITIPKENINYK